MKVKEDIDHLGKQVRTITVDLKLYIEKRLELLILNTGEQMSKWMAGAIQRAGGAILLLLGVCFLLVSLSIYLGDLMGHQSLGYLVVGALLLLFGFLFLKLKPTGVFRKIQNNFEDEVLQLVEKNKLAAKKKLKTESNNKVEENVQHG